MSVREGQVLQLSAPLLYQHTNTKKTVTPVLAYHHTLLCIMCNMYTCTLYLVYHVPCTLPPAWPGLAGYIPSDSTQQSVV